MSTTVQTAAASQTLQQLVDGITARLSQLAKDPPDLLGYLRAHAEAITSAFKPVGLAYEMRNGPGFQRVLQANTESLGLKGAPEQEDSFRRALLLAAERKQAVLLPPQHDAGARVQGLSVEDSPAPDELPVFNRTPYEQHFIPIPLGNAVAGVLHIWFTPGNHATSNARSVLIRQICADAELYLKARQAKDMSAEVTRLSGHVRLLEELTGDIELESVSWNLVNFAREAVGCERVCLFVARHYDRALSEERFEDHSDREFVLQACSGLKKPHPRSEQAMTLQRVAQKLTQMSFVKPAAAPVNGTAAPSEEPAAPAAEKSSAQGQPADQKAKDTALAKSASAPANGTARPRPQITLIMRDPAKVATRPPEINEYFDLMPMNWATVIPLMDRDDRVCGILFFEGLKLEEKLGMAVKPMVELSVSAGRTLGTALYIDQHRSMRWARSVVSARQRFINTPAKRKFMTLGLPLLIIIGLLCIPLQYHIKGDASVLAVKQSALPALVSTRLLEVLVHEGEQVKAGQLLARFDTQDIRLQLQSSEQEQQRYLLESDNALAAGNEFQMQTARLNADKAGALIQKLRSDLERAEIRAPFDGIVLGAQTLSTRLGEILRVGEGALQVVDPKAWQVKASLREKDVIFLDEQFQKTGPIPATLRLAADPATRYDLALTARSQLAYGLDMNQGEYQFIAVLPLNRELDDPNFLKSGFTGRISFDAGRRPLAFVLFRDFIQYLTVRFF